MPRWTVFESESALVQPWSTSALNIYSYWESKAGGTIACFCNFTSCHQAAIDPQISLPKCYKYSVVDFCSSTRAPQILFVTWQTSNLSFKGHANLSAFFSTSRQYSTFKAAASGKVVTFYASPHCDWYSSPTTVISQYSRPTSNAKSNRGSLTALMEEGVRCQYLDRTRGRGRLNNNGQRGAKEMYG